MTNNSNENGRSNSAMRRAGHDFGRRYYEDSVAASSEDPGGTADGYDYSGYDSHMATRIGDEEDYDPRTDRLREIHEGRHRSDGDHKIREDGRDKRHVLKAICSDLAISNSQKDLVVSTVEGFDMSIFGGQKEIVRVTLGTIAVLVDERGNSSPQSYDDLVSRSEEFRLICEVHDISMSDLATVKDIVREALDNGEVDIDTGTGLRDPALPEPTPPWEIDDEYWDLRPAGYWAKIARSWHHVDNELKEAVPDEYRDLVDRLRRWEPWKINKERTTQKTESKAVESTGEMKADMESEIVELLKEMEVDTE